MPLYLVLIISNLKSLYKSKTVYFNLKDTQKRSKSSKSFQFQFQREGVNNFLPGLTLERLERALQKKSA
jgi:hypothetical protein